MITEIKYKKQICDIGKRIYEKGFVAANDGNISIRVSDNEFLITPTGVSKGFITPEMLVKVDGQGNVLEGTPPYRPTSEMKMHLRVYKERPDIQAVVHVHPPYATAFAIAGIPLDQAIMPESVVFLGTIPVAEYGTPSTNEIPVAVQKFVHHHQGVLLENHGALTWGKDLEHAYYLMESLEFTAKINWIAKQINGDRELSKKHVQTLVELKTKMGINSNSPIGAETVEGIHAKKISPSLEQSISEQDINLIVDKVTKNVLEELKKLF
ncbi:class II aldolase/adducin family protein [Neobacillus vireti]|uniref:Class II aldolase/adducin family protein n=1 Tax=Neobacillus vireti LMG 21834 TaxID=1131730 RepID=A0AB94IT68_9BACI|nr:class II aldolase/adducin family protein [Neobacillus vireti]ETI70280.1 class II aldolase/adducin family protein [Neobacillus vireti LMG 21834]KLT15852.1 aldolase [Neobacillus vireti]